MTRPTHQTLPYTARTVPDSEPLFKITQSNRRPPPFADAAGSGRSVMASNPASSFAPDVWYGVNLCRSRQGKWISNLSTAMDSCTYLNFYEPVES
jgi:hypothetical protein